MSKSKAQKGSKVRVAVFQQEFVEDLKYWVINDKRIAKRALDLVEEITQSDPFTGTGKPEPLKGISDTWSRRLTREHRIVYLVRDDRIDFIQARYHY